MFVSQVPGANAGASAGVNISEMDWSIMCERANEEMQKEAGDGGGPRLLETLNNPLNSIGGYFPDMGVEHVNTTAAEQSEALATLRDEESEGSDRGEEVVGGSMVGGGDGGGSGGVRSKAPALAAVARTTLTVKQLQAMDYLIKGEREFAATLAEVRSKSGAFKPESEDGFLKWMKCIDIQVNRPATLCKQCAIYSLQCVADSLGTACQRRVLVISI